MQWRCEYCTDTSSAESTADYGCWTGIPTFAEGMHLHEDQLKKREKRQKKSWSKNELRKSEGDSKSRLRRRASGEPKRSYEQRKKLGKQRSAQEESERADTADTIQMRTRTATDEAGARSIVKKTIEVKAGREVRDGTHTERGNAPTQETEMNIMTGLQAGMTVSVDIESTHIHIVSESMADEMIKWSAGGTTEIETMIDGVTTTIEDDKYVALTSSLAGTFV